VLAPYSPPPPSPATTALFLSYLKLSLLFLSKHLSTTLGSVSTNTALGTRPPLGVVRKKEGGAEGERYEKMEEESWLPH